MRIVYTLSERFRDGVNLPWLDPEIENVLVGELRRRRSIALDEDVVLEDHDIITCWCGVSGTFDELFEEPEARSCYGTGMLDCLCGGDMCVCHNHGEVQCDGCEDCCSGDEHDDDDDAGDLDDDDWSDVDEASPASERAQGDTPEQGA